MTLTHNLAAARDVPVLRAHIPAKRREEFFARLDLLCPLVTLQERLTDAAELSATEGVRVQSHEDDFGDVLEVKRSVCLPRLVAITTEE